MEAEEEAEDRESASIVESLDTGLVTAVLQTQDATDAKAEVTKSAIVLLATAEVPVHLAAAVAVVVSGLALALEVARDLLDARTKRTGGIRRIAAEAKTEATRIKKKKRKKRKKSEARVRVKNEKLIAKRTRKTEAEAKNE